MVEVFEVEVVYFCCVWVEGVESVCVGVYVVEEVDCGGGFVWGEV